MLIHSSRSVDQPVDLLRLHRLKPEKYTVFLSSSSGGVNGHRYDFLFGSLSSASLSVLDQVDVSSASDAVDLPFIGGYFVLLPYEYAQLVEPSLDLLHGNFEPLVWKVGDAFIWDRQDQILYALSGSLSGVDALWQDWDSAIKSPVQSSEAVHVKSLQEDEPSRYLQGVRACQQYILSGDAFQVNLSRAWRAEVEKSLSPADVFDVLRQVNPAPFSALCCWNDQAVISSSPERLVRVRHGQVDTRPIAGTRRRDDDLVADMALKAELLSHPKENAEHVMLLDLERNDLGRVCVPGSVVVDELMTVETYPTVHHIVSNVRGQLRSGVTAKAVLDAVFPGGTITGCPKVRTMEIIAELESEPRGIYTGSLGYVSVHGAMDFNILIRSFYWQPGCLTFRAGAGVVYDSDPASELEETRHKAKGLMRAFVSVVDHDV